MRRDPLLRRDVLLRGRIPDRGGFECVDCAGSPRYTGRLTDRSDQSRESTERIDPIRLKALGPNRSDGEPRRCFLPTFLPSVALRRNVLRQSVSLDECSFESGVCAMPDLWSDVPLIDCDSHVTGRPDLWSTCVPQICRAEAPRVASNEASREGSWHRQAVGVYLARTSR